MASCGPTELVCTAHCFSTELNEAGETAQVSDKLVEHSEAKSTDASAAAADVASAPVCETAVLNNVTDSDAVTHGGCSTTCRQSWAATCSRWWLTLVGGWKTYARQSVVFAGVALALLYMTVLGFDSITIGQSLIHSHYLPLPLCLPPLLCVGTYLVSTGDKYDYLFH